MAINAFRDPLCAPEPCLRDGAEETAVEQPAGGNPLESLLMGP